jgi:hypothetical protein
VLVGHDRTGRDGGTDDGSRGPRLRPDRSAQAPRRTSSLLHQ